MMTPNEIDKMQKESEYEAMQDRINKLEIEVAELKKTRTCISLREYNELVEGLEQYEKIEELKPIAEMMKRHIDKFNVWA